MAACGERLVRELEFVVPSWVAGRDRAERWGVLCGAAMIAARAVVLQGRAADEPDALVRRCARIATRAWLAQHLVSRRPPCEPPAIPLRTATGVLARVLEVGPDHADVTALVDAAVGAVVGRRSRSVKRDDRAALLMHALSQAASREVIDRAAARDAVRRCAALRPRRGAWDPEWEAAWAQLYSHAERAILPRLSRSVRSCASSAPFDVDADEVARGLLAEGLTALHRKVNSGAFDPLLSETCDAAEAFVVRAAWRALSSWHRRERRWWSARSEASVDRPDPRPARVLRPVGDVLVRESLQRLEANPRRRQRVALLRDRWMHGRDYAWLAREYEVGEPAVRQAVHRGELWVREIAITDPKLREPLVAAWGGSRLLAAIDTWMMLVRSPLKQHSTATVRRFARDVFDTPDAAGHFEELADALWHLDRSVALGDFATDLAVENERPIVTSPHTVADAARWTIDAARSSDLDDRVDDAAVRELLGRAIATAGCLDGRLCRAWFFGLDPNRAGRRVPASLTALSSAIGRPVTDCGASVLAGAARAIEQIGDQSPHGIGSRTPTSRPNASSRSTLPDPLDAHATAHDEANA